MWPRKENSRKDTVRESIYTPLELIPWIIHHLRKNTKINFIFSSLILKILAPGLRRFVEKARKKEKKRKARSEVLQAPNLLN